MTPEGDALLAAAAAKLRAADLLLAEGLPDDAASRAYYAAFHAVSALNGAGQCLLESCTIDRTL